MYYENNAVQKCTRCGKEFTDLRLGVELNLHTERVTENGFWEEIPNLCQSSNEYLCAECFEKFCDVFSQLDVAYQERYPDLPPDLNADYEEDSESNQNIQVSNTIEKNSSMEETNKENL